MAMKIISKYFLYKVSTEYILISSKLTIQINPENNLIYTHYQFLVGIASVYYEVLQSEAILNSPFLV